jgi:hypothetical protein
MNVWVADETRQIRMKINDIIKFDVTCFRLSSEIEKGLNAANYSSFSRPSLH